jgi:hypothetical protein
MTRNITSQRRCLCLDFAFNVWTLRYGHEVARLAFAQSTAKSAFDKARRGASKSVMEDVKACYHVPF